MVRCCLGKTGEDIHECILLLYYVFTKRGRAEYMLCNGHNDVTIVVSPGSICKRFVSPACEVFLGKRAF